MGDTFIYRHASAIPTSGSPIARVTPTLLASEVTDVNGNWVRYTYDDEGWPTRIHSNDGRDIRINETRPVTSVTANGRTWTYDYTTNDAGHKYLSSVTLPDNRAWSMTLHHPLLGVNPAHDCEAGDGLWEITHPSGVTGSNRPVIPPNV